MQKATNSPIEEERRAAAKRVPSSEAAVLPSGNALRPSGRVSRDPKHDGRFPVRFPEASEHDTPTYETDELRNLFFGNLAIFLAQCIYARIQPHSLTHIGHPKGERGYTQEKEEHF